MKAALLAILIMACIAVTMAQQQSELSGFVKYNNKTAARGVIVTIGTYSVVTNKDGYYRMTFVKPGSRVVSITPPYKATKYYKVRIEMSPTRKDFEINW